MRARLTRLLLLALVLAALPGPAFASIRSETAPARAAVEPWWQQRIDALIGERSVSVAIGSEGVFWYRHLGSVKRIPASNEKLLLSMALLARVGSDRVLMTRAMATAAPAGGIIDGDLWLVGRGDPEVGPATLDELSARIAAAGVTRITGSVIGDTGPFKRDWWARGWKEYFAEDEVPFPTALTFRGNVGPSGGHIDDPEARAAAYLTKSLRRRGVEVGGRPSAKGSPKRKLVKIAAVGSSKMIDIVRHMNVDSVNFDAEVLGKLLGAETSGTGSIAAAAAAIDAYAARRGAPEFRPNDASGLSYANRITARGMVRLLWAADAEPWASELRFALPTGGQGTLEGRLGRLRVRAKTGTLAGISALSGWVWSNRAGRWIEFSIVSAGMAKSEAVRIEDAIVQLVSAAAPPT